MKKLDKHLQEMGIDPKKLAALKIMGGDNSLKQEIIYQEKKKQKNRKKAKIVKQSRKMNRKK